MSLRVVFRSLLILAFVAAAFVSPAVSADKLGVVLLHGKGAPNPRGLLGPLIDSLEGAGFPVVAPEMPWSKSRMLAKGYEDSMAEIDAAVKALKAKGATRIVVGGHSMGANAAMGYGARRDGLAGILAMAPGHVPDASGFQRIIGHDYKRARELAAAGKGGETGEFNDVNQGRSFSIKVKVSDYLSWFDPDGPAVFPKNAAALKVGTPLFWIIADKDNMLKRGDGEDYAFAKAPKHPKSAYMAIDSNHRNTPKDGADKIVDWLKKL
jgi:pimeloyl-ACP methyl ester carboxylesterase